MAGGSGQNGAARGARRRRRARPCRDRGCPREALRSRGRSRTAGGSPGASALGRLPAAVRSVGVGPTIARITVRVRLRLGALRPPAKRRWGWYVLPMLFRDRLVGRIEPRIDRDGGQVQVLDLWWEDGFAPGRTEGFVDAMRDALRAYLRFADATRLEWPAHLARRNDSSRQSPSRRRTARARGRHGRTARRASQARARPEGRAADAARPRSPRGSHRAGAISR